MAITLHRPEVALRAPGVSMQVFTVRLERGVETERDEPTNALIYRYTPPHLAARGRFGGGEAAGRYVDIGPLQFTPANFPMRFVSVSSEERIAQCVFDTEPFEVMTRLAGHWRTEHVGACLDMRNPAIRDGMLRLVAEAREPGFGSQILAESLARGMSIELARHFRLPSPQTSGAATIDARLLRRIEHFVRECCGKGKSPTIATIADLCGVSPSHLMRNFRASTGKTLHGHVEQVRIELARDLLLGTALSMKVIAGRSGFASASRLSESFRRHVGMTPSEYRLTSRI